MKKIDDFDIQIQSDELAEIINYNDQFEDPLSRRRIIWPLSQAAKTSPFHGEGGSSTLPGVTKPNFGGN